MSQKVFITDTHRIVSAVTLRRFVLGKSGLWPGRRWTGKTGAAQAIREMGGLQVDPVVVIARNHDVELHSRVADYQPEHLNELLYTDHQFFDYGGLLYIYPMDELPHWKTHMGRNQWDHDREYIDQNPGLLDSVRAELRTRGPLAQRDLEGTARLENYRARKDVGLALYYLWRVGELMTAGRRNFDRLYDFAEKVAPSEHLTISVEAEAEAFFLRKALVMSAMPNLSEWRGWFAYFVRRTVTRAEMLPLIAGLIEAGEITPLRVTGKKDIYYIASSDRPLVESLDAGAIPDQWTPLATTTDTEVTLLSPLDPVSARGRAATLFDFAYTWEIYTPVEKRKWGYYVLPILYGDHLVGRIDMKLDRKTKTMCVKGFWLEDAETAKDSAFAIALVRGLVRFTHFHGVTRLDASAIQPVRLRATALFKGTGVTLV